MWRSVNFNVILMMAAIVFLSGTFLLYTAVIAPAQIFLWESDDEECNVFPTLYIDLFVDTFFIVSVPSIMWLLKKSQIQLDLLYITIISA
jgi:hypothetical protein